MDEVLDLLRSAYMVLDDCSDKLAELDLGYEQDFVLEAMVHLKEILEMYA